ncbi:MAG: dTDP-4-dehydrorhamnose 3,5-epimerase [Henriciella sp.]|jgi:dTDP-4-dehydrorhamnose 3,5-epimerase
MALEIERLNLSEVMIIRPKKFGDERGFFSEVWNAEAFAEVGLDMSFVQDNHSYSAVEGTVRGLHYQIPPFAQDKLLRCTRGRILDVVVDIRTGSPNFGKWVSTEISADNWAQIYVPKGFAHGFITLTPDCEVQYKVTAPYSPAHEMSIAWNDPDLAIEWGVESDGVTLSEKDAQAPLLRNVETGFA